MVYKTNIALKSEYNKYSFIHVTTGQANRAEPLHYKDIVLNNIAKEPGEKGYIHECLHM